MVRSSLISSEIWEECLYFLSANGLILVDDILNSVDFTFQKLLTAEKICHFITTFDSHLERSDFEISRIF